jgi:hypothetical protein
MVQQGQDHNFDVFLVRDDDRQDLKDSYYADDDDDDDDKYVDDDEYNDDYFDEDNFPYRAPIKDKGDRSSDEHHPRHVGPPPPRHGRDGHDNRSGHSGALRPPPLPPSYEEDEFFIGALGFGADGDECLYTKFDQLTAPCQSSIEDLYTLREEYWNENQAIEESANRSHGAFIVWFLLGVLLFLGFLRRRAYNEKTKEARQFLDAIDANPSLKQTVETSTGLSLPKTKADKSLCYADENQSCGSVFLNVCRIFTIFCVVVLVAFLISVSSLELTASILGAMDNNAASVDAPPASPFFALFILIVVCSIEIFIFFLIVKGLRTCITKCQQEDTATVLSHEDDRYPSFRGQPPSAPLANARNGVFPSSRLQQFRNYAIGRFRRTTEASSPSAHTMYSPLMDASVHSMQPQTAEMVELPPSQVTYAQVNMARPVGGQVSFV